MDYVKIPFGLNLETGQIYGSGEVVMKNGVRMLEVPLWRSYLATVVGVLIEVPVMLMLVRICLRTRHWFE